MKFGIGCPPKESGQSAEAIARAVQRAENCGFNEAWIGDSQGIWQDVYVSMTLCALRTRRIRVGAGVTNFSTRHPAVTARAMATLDEVSGGRALLGFGAGDTAFKHLGLRPSSLKEIEEGIELVRRLLAGEEGAYQGNTVPRFTGFRPRPIPIYLAAYGPRMLELAGRVADGVNVPVGITSELIQYGFRHIESGARAANRDPASITVGFQVGCSIRENGDLAKEEVKSWAARRALSPVPHSVLGLSRDEARKFRQEYQYTDHLVPHARHGAEVPIPWATGVALAGTPEECVDRLHAIQEQGIQQVILVPATQSSDELLRVFEKKILPHFC